MKLLSMNAGGISAYLDLNTGKFDSKLRAAQSDVNSFAGKMESSGKSMQKTGKSLMKGVTLPLVGVAAASLKVGMDFETGMSKVEAISGATGAEMEQLEGLAREMGATTKFSAKNHWHSATKIAA